MLHTNCSLTLHTWHVPDGFYKAHGLVLFKKFQVPIPFNGVKMKFNVRVILWYEYTCIVKCVFRFGSCEGLIVYTTIYCNLLVL